MAGEASVGAPAAALLAAVSVAGTPYVWGGTDPRLGVDCSGLVQWAYRQAGVSLPRTAQQQFEATAPVGRDSLQAGDLVFFANTYKNDPAEPITHVGIYLGDGWMLNAPREGETVQPMSVFTGFWGAHYAGAGRVGTAPPRDRAERR